MYIVHDITHAISSIIFLSGTHVFTSHQPLFLIDVGKKHSGIEGSYVYKLCMAREVGTCIQHTKDYQGSLHRKILVQAKLVNLLNCELFAKILLTSIDRYMENVYAIYTDCCLFVKFSLPIAFTCMVNQNLPLPNISHVRNG